VFKRVNRLTGTREIRSLQRGRPYFSTHFVLKYAPAKSGAWRCAVVVSTKVSKKAVVRNRLKRQAREVIEALLKGKKEINLIVSAKKVVPDDIKIYQDELIFLLSRARII
jgi:ribonuclease P protein component